MPRQQAAGAAAGPFRRDPQQIIGFERRQRFAEGGRVALAAVDRDGVRDEWAEEPQPEGQQPRAGDDHQVADHQQAEEEVAVLLQHDGATRDGAEALGTPPPVVMDRTRAANSSLNTCVEKRCA